MVCVVYMWCVCGVCFSIVVCVVRIFVGRFGLVVWLVRCCGLLCMLLGLFLYWCCIRLLWVGGLFFVGVVVCWLGLLFLVSLLYLVWVTTLWWLLLSVPFGSVFFHVDVRFVAFAFVCYYRFVLVVVLCYVHFITLWYSMVDVVYKCFGVSVHLFHPMH